MKTTKSFINAVNADLAKSNVRYSSMWRVAEMVEFVGKPSKTYVAMVHVKERFDGEWVFWIYCNFDISMGYKVGKVTRKTVEEANKEFADMLA